VHEAHADGSNSVASPREDAKDPATGAVAEAEDAPLSADDRVAHDVDVAAEQRFDLRQRYAVTETFRQVPCYPSRNRRISSMLSTPLHMRKQPWTKAESRPVQGRRLAHDVELG